MSDSKQKHLSNIRTFAKDLDAVRANKKPHVEEVRNNSIPNRPIELSNKKDLEETVSEMIPKQKNPVPVSKITVPNLSPEKKPSVHNPIPAFHELKKHHPSSPNNNDRKINIVSRHASKTSEIKSSEPKKVPTRHIETIKPIRKFTGGGGATIITDTKESSFKLLPSIIDSIRSWFKELNQRRKKKKTPTYTVPETNRRKGVIQKATSKTGTIFTADNDTIKEQIRRRRLQEKEKEAETSWSPFTETGYNLLEAPDEPANIKVEFKKQARIDDVKPPTPLPTPPIPSVTPEVKEDEIPAPVPEVTTAVVPEVKEESVQKIENTPIAAMPEINVETPEEFIPEQQEEVFYEEPAPELEVSIPEPQTKNLSPANFLQRLRQQETNTQAVVVLMIVIGLVAFVFSVKFIFQYFMPGTDAPKVEIVQKQLLQGAKQINLGVANNVNSSLVDKVSELAKTIPGELVEISVVPSSGIELDSASIFKSLQFKTEPSLTQSINTAHFVSVNQSEPALILGFTDEYTVRGGLLKWEATMNKDLSELLSVENDNKSKFKDVSITGFDVRILKTENGSQIVYGIVNHNTVIITTSESKFSQIVKLGFPN